ncbi:MAG: carbohydrate ABC transporter permease [Acutalibacteraceae bacterium]
MKYIDYMQLNPFQKAWYNIRKFFVNLPKNFMRIIKIIGSAIASFFCGIGRGFKSFGVTFAKGDLATKASYLIMGIGNFTKGQRIKGLLFFIVEAAYACFMVFFGSVYLAKFDNLGDSATIYVKDALGNEIPAQGDNSMIILLYGVLTIVLSVVFIAVYVANTKSAMKCQQMVENGEKPIGFKEEMKEYLDGKFHVTLLAFPTLLISVFTILPLIFMILIAFTNYRKPNIPPGSLFTWTGLQTFGEVFKTTGGGAKMGHTFLALTQWTIIWAVFATFSNYLFGMIIALMINKKGIKLKALWRTLFVITVAVPQFVTLLLMNQMLQTDGAINVILGYFGAGPINFLNSTPLVARITVIVINMWVGVPYTILITSGILMNIPEDLYESARIDGAGPVKAFFKITLPYMLFVTTPYLITQFIGNINNFNVIYLLSAGGPSTETLYQAGYTDLLVTWLFNLTMSSQDYNYAAAIGIMVFIVCATLSLITFNLTKSSKNEEEFS